MNFWINDGDELFATVMSHKEFHKEVIDKYVPFLRKYKNGSASFINDGLRIYCRDNDIKYEVSAGIECVKLIDTQIREEMRLGNI